MLSPVRSRLLALLGLAAMLPIAWSVASGAVAIDVAAFRAAILLGVLAAVDRLVVPIVALLLQPPRRPVASERDRRTSPAGDTPR